MTITYGYRICHETSYTGHGQKKKKGMQNEGLDKVFSDKGKQITLGHT